MFAKLPGYLRTLHARVIILIVIVGIIPYAFLSYRNLNSQRNELVRQSEQLLSTSATTIAIVAANFIDEAAYDARSIAMNERILALEGEDAPFLLDNLRFEIYTELEKLFIVGLDGNIQFASDRSIDATSTSPAHLESYKKALRGDQGWVVDTSLQSSDLVIHLHTPIRNSNEQIVLILGTPISFESLERRIRTIVAEDIEEDVYILEEASRRVILATNSAERDFNTIAPGIFTDIPSIRGRIANYNIDETDYQIGVANIPDSGWIVVTERPLSLAFPENIQPNRIGALATASMIFIVGVGLAYFVTSIITRPVRQLVKVAEALGADNFDVPLPGNFGADHDSQVLINAFSSMRDAVNERQEKLLKSEDALRKERNQLSTRVHERTVELERSNSKLGKALEQKEAFLSRVNHEFRTPLNIILGMSEALNQGVYNPLNDTQNKVVETIHGSGTHLLSKIDDIMSVSKLMSGENNLVMKPFNLHDVCLSVVDEVRETCEERSIELRYVALDDSDFMLEGDGSCITEILCNLMSNAVRFTPVGGKVGMHVIQPSQSEVLVIVWDTGIGIAETDFGRIFEPFEQIDNRLSREYEGVGLGLALAKQYALQHGGDIELSSELQKGSKFKLLLPAHQTKEASAVIQPVVTRSIRPKILLAEDNELAIQTVSDYLIYFGYDLITARTGHEVLAFAATTDPDLILMDVQMPGIDGLECMRRLREEPGLSDIPIIALTGMAMKQDEARCIAAGANAYMSKPVILKELRKRIDTYLN